MHYVRETVRIDVPIGRVWCWVAGFGALEPWCPAVKSVELEGHGVGAVRTVHLEGLVSREQLLEVDAAAHRIRYSLLEPGPLPLRNVRSTLQLYAIESNLTELVWSSEADEAEPAIKAQVGALVGGFYRECLRGLKVLLEGERHVSRLGESLG
jgi:Polyketide cyclase / dehydrase and lipid transport